MNRLWIVAGILIALVLVYKFRPPGQRLGSVVGILIAVGLMLLPSPLFWIALPIYFFWGQSATRFFQRQSSHQGGGYRAAQQKLPPMVCPRCGTENADHLTRCKSCNNTLKIGG